MYLHQQIELVGSQPVPLERVSNYRGLSSRSIRVGFLEAFSSLLIAKYLDLVGSYGKYNEAPQSAYLGRRTKSKSFCTRSLPKTSLKKMLVCYLAGLGIQHQ
jgi:hypothetical protein